MKNTYKKTGAGSMQVRAVCQWLVVFALSGVSFSARAVAHFIDEELAAVAVDADVLYQRTALPINLRRLVVCAALAQQFVQDERSWYRACDAVYTNVPLSKRIFFVSGAQIPQISAYLATLSAKMGICVPLVCVADESDSSAGVSVCSLGGGQYVLLLSRPFLAMHSLTECEGIFLHEFAHIKRHHCKQQEALGYLFPVLLGIGGVVGLTRVRPHWRSLATAVGLTLLWGAASWLVSEGVDAAFSRSFEREADTQALAFFSGSPEQFITALTKVRDFLRQTEEQASSNYKKHCAYTRRLIEALPQTVPLRIRTDLQLRLRIEEQRRQSSFRSDESSFFDGEPSPQERIDSIKNRLKNSKQTKGS